jgi:hypothetical protein
MGPINLQVRYRPIRIGWCVREGDFEELRKALRLTHTFWGGRFNPIIPLGDPELTRLLIRTFRVDCLCCISESTEGKAVMEEFKHLLWPNFYNDLFVDYWGNGHKTAAFLDVYHPARRLYERNIEGRENPTCQGTLFRWDNADPLSDVFLATFGGYPTHGEIGKDYEGLFQEYLFARDIEIANGAVVLPTAFMEHSPSALTEFDPQPIGYASERAWPGLYYGQSRNFADLVNFWNLRASGIEVLFYDPSFRSRLGAIVSAGRKIPIVPVEKSPTP